MKYVWIVEECYDYEGSTIKEVCVTEKIAIREAERIIGEYRKEWEGTFGEGETKYNRHTSESEDHKIHTWRSMALGPHYVAFRVEVKSK